MMRILMLGAPGVGKGSQASKIAQALSIPHVSTGDIFREQIARDTEIGQKVSFYMNQGMLVPDEITIDVLAVRLTNADCRNGFILDGFPRTVQQARGLDMILSEMNIGIDIIINISLDDTSIVRRITGRRTCSQCGSVYHIEDNPPQTEGLCNYCPGLLFKRKDDSSNIVKKRLLVYQNQTKPLIEYYMDRIKIIRIKSDNRLETTTQNVFEALEIR